MDEEHEADEAIEAIDAFMREHFDGKHRFVDEWAPVHEAVAEAEAILDTHERSERIWKALFTPVFRFATELVVAMSKTADIAAKLGQDPAEVRRHWADHLRLLAEKMDEAAAKSPGAGGS